MAGLKQLTQSGLNHYSVRPELVESSTRTVFWLVRAPTANSFVPMRGFTLLEMLVVLVIASIILSMVTLNLMPNAQTVLREESQRLAFLMENGAMASQAGGQPLAWSGTGNSYRFWLRTREGEWVRIERDNLLHPRTLPDAVRIGEVSFNGRRIEPGSLVVLSPELSAKNFRVTLLSDDLDSDIVGNGLGKVKVVAREVP